MFGDQLLDPLPGGKAVGQRFGPTPGGGQVALLNQEFGKIVHGYGASEVGGLFIPPPRLFLQTLSRFAEVLPARYDLDDALTELTASVTAVLGLCGSGVTLADDGRMRYVTTVTLASAELERDHAQPHPCPCRDVYATGEVVRVMDIREESALPELAATAGHVSVAGVAAIPMRLDRLHCRG